MNVENRTIFEGDNLHILRGLDSETIDLIYLDPPFNSNRTYETLIGSAAAGAAFKDAWTLSDLDNAWHGELAEHEPGLYSAISAAEFTHGKSMKAYLIMMGIRMLEMRRVLKPAGSIYLHCDPTASHYLKTMMDVELQQFKSHKHVMFGMQEGKCNGCQVSFHFRNMTIDHIHPRSREGSDDLDNLQLLCGACNSTKGDRTQAYLIQALKEQGVLRE